MHEDHYRQLERMYLTANVNRLLYESVTLHIQHRQATLTLEIDERYHHAGRSAHGSVYFKLLDDAAFFAVNSVVRDVFVLTVSFHLHLLRPVASGQLRAEGQVRSVSRTLFTADAVLFNAKGKEVAAGTGTFARSEIPLTADVGYA